MIELVEWEDERVTPQNIGAKMAKLRRQSGRTLFDISIDAMLTSATISRLENGGACKLSTVCLLLEVYGYELIIRRAK